MENHIEIPRTYKWLEAARQMKSFKTTHDEWKILKIPKLKLSDINYENLESTIH